MVAKINLSQSEYRVLRTLINNSRLSINEIAKEAGVNRNTARKIINDLKSKGIIKRFTVELNESNIERMFLLELKTVKDIPDSLIIFKLKLANDNYIILCRNDIINYDISYLNVNIVKELEFKNPITNLTNIYCDFCGKEIIDSPIEFMINNKTYYACCHNCERDLKKRLKE